MIQPRTSPLVPHGSLDATYPLPGFPRVMLHEGINGRGWPLIPSDGAPVDESVALAFAKFQFWCVYPVDIYDSRHDAIATVKRMRPDMRVFAHVLGPKVWPAQGNGWAGRLWSKVSPYMLKTTSGAVWSPMYVDVTDPAMQTVMVTAWDELMASGLFDGILVDWMAPSDGWIYTLDPTLDLTRWGGSIAVWDAEMTAAKGTMFARLRAAWPDKFIFGNGGYGGRYPGGEVCNGWFRENFPNQNGGSWASNMTGANGMLNDSTFYRPAPFQGSVLAVDSIYHAPLATASACLGGGIVVCGPGNYDAATRYYEWWDASWGDAKANGYLGQPTGPVVLSGGTWRRTFEGGIVSVNPATLASSISRT